MDIDRVFREYARLEKKRAHGELTSEELARWTACNSVLAKRLTPGVREELISQRKSLRVPTRLGLSFTNVGELRQCLMTDLSRGGLFIRTDRPVDLGTRIELTIRIGDKDRIVKVRAEVVTHNIGPNFRTHERGMGLRFLDMDEDTEKQIGELYEYSLRHASELIPSGKR